MIEIHFTENQLGSHYLKKDLMADLNVKYKDVAGAYAKANSIGIGQSFLDDQTDLQTGPLSYACLALEDSTPLERRNFSKPTVLHIDLRLIDPHQATAIESHPINTFGKEKSQHYLSWEELMISILKLRENSQIRAFHLSGYCPDRDRRLLLNIENQDDSPLNFHLTSSQETHQFTLALLYNCIEVLAT